MISAPSPTSFHLLKSPAKKKSSKRKMGKKKGKLGRQKQAKAEQDPKQSLARAATDSGTAYIYYI